MSETGLEPEAWIYASVVVPIVISVSPIGALVSSYLHRQVIASFLYVLDTIAIVSQKNQSPFYRVTDGTRYLYRFIGKVGIKYWWPWVGIRFHRARIVSEWATSLIYVNLDPGTDTDSMVRLALGTEMDIDLMARLASGKLILVSYRHRLMSKVLSSQYPRLKKNPKKSFFSNANSEESLMNFVPTRPLKDAIYFKVTSSGITRIQYLNQIRSL